MRVQRLKCPKQATDYGELRNPLLKCPEQAAEHGELQDRLL